MTAGTRFLIVNADDFGQSSGINRGIIKAHADGIVTSASLMVRWPAAAEAAAYARAHPRLSLGLHFDLAECTHDRGTWVPVYMRVNWDDRKEVEQELREQLNLFRELVGQDPTHLDSHQHVHLRPAIHPAFVACAQELSVPLRRAVGHVRYCGAFYGQTGEGFPLPEAITVEAILKIVASLPEGMTELACHPGLITGGEELQTMYRTEREQELQALCDPCVRRAISSNGIRLVSFTDRLLHSAD